MLDDDIKQQLSAYLERVKQPFELVASLDDGASSAELRELLDEVVCVPTATTLASPRSPSRARAAARSCALPPSPAGMNSPA